MSRAVALVLLVAVAACGRKGAVVAPELIRPEPATDLSAVATPEGIRLTWVRPDRYQGGGRMHDLGRFVVQRAGADDAEIRFREVGRVELVDQDRIRPEHRLEWSDRDVAAGNRYLYRVIAVTVGGDRSIPAGPVSVRFGSPAETPAPAPAEP